MAENETLAPPAPEKETPPESKPEDELDETPDQSLTTDEELDEEIAKEKELAEARKPRSELDKALFTGKKLVEKITQLGGDPSEILGKPDEEIGEDGKPKPLTEERVRQIAEDSVKTRSYKEQVKEEIRRRAKTPKEAELAILRFENRMIPTGNIDEDVDGAIFLANRKQITARMSEMDRTLRSKDLKTKGGGAAGQRPPIEEKAPALAPQDMKIVERQGWIWYPKAGPDGKGRYGPKDHEWSPEQNRFIKKRSS